MVPSDDQRLADDMRVLVAAVERSRKKFASHGQSPEKPSRILSHKVKQQSLRIGDTLRKRTDEAREAWEKTYLELVEMSRKTVARSK